MMRTATATATATSTISIEPFGTGAGVFEINDALVRRYARFTTKKASEIYSARPLPETEVYRPRHISPGWLSEIESVISGSVGDEPDTASVRGQRLRQDVATAAIRFFQETADLLPGKPYVYGSKQGDLVAEFRTPRGTLTSVISPDFVVLFSVVDDIPTHKQVSASENIRGVLTPVTKSLLAGTHGDLANTK